MADERDITQKLWGLPKAPARAPPRPPGQRLEREIVKSIERDLNRLPGVHVTRVTVAMATLDSGHKARLGLPGQGDLVGGVQVRGLDVVLEVEVKRPGEHQRPSQVKRQELVQRRGGCYLVAHSSAEAIAGVMEFRAAALVRLQEVR